MLTHEDIQDILRVLETSPFDELELETDRFKLTLRRAAGPQGGWSQEHETHARAAAAVAAPTTAGSGVAKSPPPVTAALAGAVLVEIRAPLIGTFYRAPKPGAAPFVEVGTVVSSDTVVAILETMKLMTPVHAGASGRVVEICIADGQFVEQHQVLLRLEPSQP